MWTAQNIRLHLTTNTFSFCLTGLFFQSLPQIRLRPHTSSRDKTLVIALYKILQWFLENHWRDRWLIQMNQKMAFRMVACMYRQEPLQQQPRPARVLPHLISVFLHSQHRATSRTTTRTTTTTTTIIAIATATANITTAAAGELAEDKDSSFGHNRRCAIFVTVKDHKVADAEEFVYLGSFCLSRLSHSFISPKHPWH